ncbi:hippocampus abundant transcript 1 protein-like protein [Leptotrombidium deliense]|uniref:Hippocampus abundant transcript 1 protein-like protein n=1 Tax=Leptotrombidium deliense TaxID=299467 RepID=A0A443SPM3_9ACAR|nr:hippocampus abundant transcript 1 protein-like protein [Leptotrombidium deliense]
MVSKRVVGVIVRSGRKHTFRDVFLPSKTKEPTVYHALVVIFLEFFAWGLLTSPMITVLNSTFPEHTFLMNGLIMGIKGFLSFLSAPLIGSLSDVWGRKFFLLITVFFTCSPIPFMKINTWWYFAMISLSGVFSVTFSVVFAYVADVTTEHERSAAYGLVSATFAASLVTSPALGAYLSQKYSESLVVFIATIIAVVDVLFILFFVPESLSEKLRLSSISLWETADPFVALRKVGKDRMILMLCTAVFLSYLPEAGQYSCFFVYLRLVIGFSAEEVALFIAVVGLMSVIAQTAVLTALTKAVGSKNTIMIGLLFAMLQLVWYGFGYQMMWAAGLVAAMSSMTYPAISTYVSTYADADKQGLVQGMITGVRGLCNGLGPLVFGLIFNLFHVDLSHNLISQLPNQGDGSAIVAGIGTLNRTDVSFTPSDYQLIPGPPFLFGAFLVFLAILVTAFIPELVHYNNYNCRQTSSGTDQYSYDKGSKHASRVNYYYTNIQHQKSDTQCVGAYPFDGKAGDNCAQSNSPCRHVTTEGYDLHRKRPVEHQLPLIADTEPL